MTNNARGYAKVKGHFLAGAGNTNGPIPGFWRVYLSIRLRDAAKELRKQHRLSSGGRKCCYTAFELNHALGGYLEHLDESKLRLISSHPAGIPEIRQAAALLLDREKSAIQRSCRATEVPSNLLG